MNELVAALNRIAEALEAGNEVHDGSGQDPETMQRLLALQERGVVVNERALAAHEEHNRLHREQGLPPVEPLKSPIQ